MTASCTPPARVARRCIHTLSTLSGTAMYRITLIVAALYFVVPVFAASPTPGHLDLDALVQRVSDTDAMGLFTKLSLKGKIDILNRDLKAYHAGRSATALKALKALKERFVLMIQEIVLLVQSKDPGLARDVAAARESLWALIADPERFRSL